MPEAVIMQVLGVGRTAIWRTRSAFVEKGLDYALHDGARPGQPLRYGTNQQTEVVALACSAPPGWRQALDAPVANQGCVGFPVLETSAVKAFVAF